MDLIKNKVACGSIIKYQNKVGKTKKDVSIFVSVRYRKIANLCATKLILACNFSPWGLAFWVAVDSGSQQRG